MKKNWFFIVSIFMLFSFWNCKNNKLKINVSDIPLRLNISHLEEDLFKLDTVKFNSEIIGIKDMYGEFFDIFTYQMIKIGGIGNENFASDLKSFLADTMILNVKKLVAEEFSNFSKPKKELTKAFKHYKYYFPNRIVPHIYTCISGFNQSIVISDTIIGISLDKYLGSDCFYYNQLAIPAYKQQKMYQKRMVPEVLHGWATIEFTKKSEETHMLSHMIYEGKLMYFLDAMFPTMHDTLKIGYSKNQLEWCNNNETQMWENLVETEKLYVSGRMDLKRFLSDAPYTNGFPIESPGRTGVWIGWQIVRQYMEKHPETTLPQLMELDNPQKILNGAGYFPE